MRYVWLCFLMGCAFEVGFTQEELNEVEQTNNPETTAPITNYDFNNKSSIQNHNMLNYDCDCSSFSITEERGLICFRTQCFGNCEDECVRELDVCVPR